MGGRDESRAYRGRAYANEQLPVSSVDGRDKSRSYGVGHLYAALRAMEVVVGAKFIAINRAAGGATYTDESHAYMGGWAR
jgi:hypothetical protein